MQQTNGQNFLEENLRAMWVLLSEILFEIYTHITL